METNSVEYETLVHLTSALQLAVKTQLTPLGGELVSSRLITPGRYHVLRNSMHPEEDRAADLVQLIQDKVQQNPQWYQVFVSALEKDRSQCGDILQTLHQTMESFQQQHTQLASTMPQSMPSSLCSPYTGMHGNKWG